MSFEDRLDYHFKKPELLVQAMTHKSFAYESGDRSFHNEKLEFLGDAVIDLVLGEFLMELFGGDEEGALSKKRASLVNEEALAEMAKTLDLSSMLRLGKGEMLTGGSAKPRLIASAWEALTGAIYLDGGFEEAKRMLRREFKSRIENLQPGQDFAADYKTRVQELAQKYLKATPAYELVSEEGPPHDRSFTVVLKMKEAEIARGIGRSKKAAEQQAAREALDHPIWTEKAAAPRRST